MHTRAHKRRKRARAQFVAGAKLPDGVWAALHPTERAAERRFKKYQRCLRSSSQSVTILGAMLSLGAFPVYRRRGRNTACR